MTKDLAICVHGTTKASPPFLLSSSLVVGGSEGRGRDSWQWTKTADSMPPCAACLLVPACPALPAGRPRPVPQRLPRTHHLALFTCRLPITCSCLLWPALPAGHPRPVPQHRALHGPDQEDV